MTEPTETPLFKLYVQERLNFTECEQSHSRALDRWIITLSGGALGISMAFLTDIAPAATAVGKRWLIAGWVMQVASIVVVLFGMLLSQHVSRWFRDDLDEAMTEGCDDSLFPRAREKQGKRRSPQVANLLSVLGVITFAISVLALARFAYLNV